MKIRVSDYIAQYLRCREGVEYIFLVSGGGMMYLLDAISRQDNLRYICHHHEQAAGMAAEGYAKESGQLGVCFATSGPGATNTVTAIVGAFVDSSPLLFITGQCKRAQTIRSTESFDLRQLGTFEVDILPIVKSITKYSVFVDDPNSIRFHLEKGCALAREGRPGPVLLDIPLDVQGALIESDELLSYTPDAVKLSCDPSKEVEAILQKVAQSRRPLILAGHGIRAANEVETFRELLSPLNIPVVTTQLGKDCLPYQNTHFVGHPGVKGDRAGNFALSNADLILILGSSLQAQTTGFELDLFAPRAYKIQVDPDSACLGKKGLGIAHRIHLPLQPFFKALREELKKRKESPLIPVGEWHEQCRKWKRTFSMENELRISIDPQIDLYDFVSALNQTLLGNETLITDSGSSFYILGQTLQTREMGRFIVSGGLGAMGYALPAATGAALASPNRSVIAVMGDGSFQSNVHELSSTVYHRLNVKVIVISNGGYASIRNTQSSYFSGHFAGVDDRSGVSFPEVSHLAKGYGVPFTKIENKETLGKSLSSILATKGPHLCEIITTKEQIVSPHVTSKRLPNNELKSTALSDMYPYLDRAVMDEQDLWDKGS